MTVELPGARAPFLAPVPVELEGEGVKEYLEKLQADMTSAYTRLFDNDDALRNLTLDDVTDVTITSVADNDFLQYDSGDSVWKNINDPIFLDDQKALFGTGSDAAIYWNATNLVIDPTLVSDGDIIIGGEIRADTTLYRRYYHLPMAALDPGASGATWIDPSANSLGGWHLDAAGEVLFTIVDIHADWDGASDMMVDLYFAIDDATTSDEDTADVKLVAYYNTVGDTATKSQTVEVATVTDGNQWTVYKAVFTLDWNIGGGNNIETGDQMMLCINLETDTSEVDSILMVAGSFYYNTTHVGIEAGDV